MTGDYANAARLVTLRLVQTTSENTACSADPLPSKASFPPIDIVLAKLGENERLSACA